MFEISSCRAAQIFHIINYRGVGPALPRSHRAKRISSSWTAFGHRPDQIGRVRGIAVAADKRIEEIGDIPTTAEAGLPDFKIEFWYAAFTTGGTPAPIVERLNAEMNKAANNPEVAAKLRGLGMNPGNGSAADFTARPIIGK